MQVPLQIVIRDFALTKALETQIRDKATKLEGFHSRINSCRVTVEVLGRHRQQGHRFQVGIDVRMPGREIVANRHQDADVYVALRDAFDAVKRQLEEIAREQRDAVKLYRSPQHGTVTRLIADQGYGFIATGDGRELYFSRENVVHLLFENLAAGMSVQFIEEPAGQSSQAKRVSKHGV